jgi:hypothetical protein
MVMTGYSFRKVWINGRQSVLSGSPIGLGRFEFSSTTNVGAVFGVGVERRVSHLLPAPEFRYTRWGSSQDIGVPAAPGNRDQVDFLLGMRF